MSVLAADNEKTEEDGSHGATINSVESTDGPAPRKIGAIEIERPVEERLVKGYSLLSIMGLGFSICK